MLLRYLTVKLKMFLGSLLWADDQREIIIIIIIKIVTKANHYKAKSKIH